MEKNVFINNVKISFKLDSGSDINVLPFNYLSKLKIDVTDVINYGIKAQTYGGFWLNVKGKIKLECSIGEKKVEIEFVIIDNDNIKPLLGRDTC